MKNRKLLLQERRNEEDFISQLFFLGRVMPEVKMRYEGWGRMGFPLRTQGRVLGCTQVEQWSLWSEEQDHTMGEDKAESRQSFMVMG